MKFSASTITTYSSSSLSSMTDTSSYSSMTSSSLGSSMFRDSNTAFRSSLTSSQMMLLDGGDTVFHRRERQSPIINPQIISEKLSEALGQAFQVRVNLSQGLFP
eukprot:TRINITY_DN10926_c0_g1_i1.p1 TRINITY_DN10926_c0_g1~~TRINITY_DN10926_c0_g1_i1.p1  ORF type:complete len:104 (-),score=20.02 TRINITY_DN10926_c0_g1_i1:161-472(-)